MQYLDKERNHLLFFHKNIEKNLWDDQWLRNWDKKKLSYYKFNPKSIVCQATSKYLHYNDGPILEGGCGLGINVYCLDKLNYNVVGIDNAKKTVENIKKNMQFLNIEFGDVRKIPYPDNYFAGYWSLGVIEHFFNGYNEILNEMKRVIKPGGFLFIMFPYMSPFRKLKSSFHLYKPFNTEFYKTNIIPRTFYQYALNKDIVIKDFKKIGFKLISLEPYSGIKGFKEEIFFLKFFIKRFFQLLYLAERPNFIQLIKSLINKILVKYFGHTIFLVFQKH